MQLAVPSVVILFNFIPLISARGKPIDIFNQAGKGDITQLRAPAQKNDKRMYNALHKYSNLKWQIKESDGTYVIPYIITGRYDSSEKATIAEAMRRIQRNTCIRFKPRTTERDYIDIQNQKGEGCYTNVGRVGGRGVLMLEANSQETCMEPEIVLHELMHVIGLWHEHMRADRDKYIKVLYQNIPQNYWSQFEKVTSQEATTYGIPYDYRSVMHYGKKAFAFPGKISMQTTDPKFQDVIGHQKDASPNDYRKICKIYGCSTCAGGKVDLEDQGGQDGRDKGDDDHDSVTEVPIVIPTGGNCVDTMGSFCRTMAKVGMLDCGYFGRRHCCATCSAQSSKWIDPFEGFDSFFRRFRF
uniref:Metalloendopeptidase n=2 Tax=Haemonchus contortus TaxID=6289 RepID=A0A7I5E5X6_HAECO